MEDYHLTEEKAMAFFSEFYRGSHHIPGHKPKSWGLGWYIPHDRGDLATFDFNELTRLVLMAHRDCIRVSVEPMGVRKLRIAIWGRKGRDGRMDERHPDIQQAIESFNI